MIFFCIIMLINCTVLRNGWDFSCTTLVSLFISADIQGAFSVFVSL